MSHTPTTWCCIEATCQMWYKWKFQNQNPQNNNANLYLHRSEKGTPYMKL